MSVVSVSCMCLVYRIWDLCVCVFEPYFDLNHRASCWPLQVMFCPAMAQAPTQFVGHLIQIFSGRFGVVRAWKFFWQTLFRSRLNSN